MRRKNKSDYIGIFIINLNYSQIGEKMQQENTSTTPSWLKAGFFIDIKDKQGDWRVAWILNVTKTQIRVRYEGWPSKFDQNFMISSSSIRPFRSVIRGYTGQVDSPPPRQHFKFSESIHKENFEAILNLFIQNMYTKDEFEINQFIRGLHYSWIDFLMTNTYTSKSQIELVFQYFFKHFQLVVKYLKDMRESQNYELWMSGLDQNGTVVDGRKAFADSYFEIFDSVFSILDGYPRLKTFFKTNTALISQFMAKPSYIQFMSEYISSVGLIQLLEENINKLLNDKKSKISLNFTTAMTRLFSALQKTIYDKQRKKQLTQKTCQYILRECSKLTDISTKQQEVQIDKIYSTCKIFLLKYAWKVQFLTKFEIININCWKQMILSQKLERKVKAINNLKTYLFNLTQKKQMMMIFNTKETIQEELRKQQIMHSIFYENQHHEIIKKGCELANELYLDNFIGMNQLEVVWKSCRHRLEAVRRIMYVFFQDLVKKFQCQELQKVVNLILSEDFTQQIDKTFFYNLFRRIMQYATQQKTQLIFRLLNLVQKRLPTNRDEIKIFSQLLTTKKSYKLGIIDKTCNNIIRLISQQKNDEKSLFYLSLANEILIANGKNKFQLDNDSFNIIFRILAGVLKLKVKVEHSEEYKNKKERIYQLLKMIEHLEKYYDFQPEEFIELWELFAQDYNKQLRETLFLPWILLTSHKGMYKLQCVDLNTCFDEKNLRKQIFNKILRKHPNLDYISLSDMQFKIFKKFMLAVNSQQGNLKETTNFLTGITYFRITEKVEVVEGIKELLDIFLNCRNQAVVQKTAKLLNQMHLNQECQTQEGVHLRAKKVDDLLNKVQKYIGDGMKKSNIRLVKNALFLLADLAITVKQTYPIPEEYKFNPHGLRLSKRNIKIKSFTDKIIIKQLQVIMTHSIKSLKKRICDELKIAPYNVKLYKQVYQYKKIQEDSSGCDDASASSAHSYDNSKSSANYSMIKKSVLQEIPNEMLYTPISCLMLPENQGVIIVKEVDNVIYENIEKFVNHKISENLLKILGDPDYYSKQSSELAYKILIEISCSVSSTSQILNNLITLMASKNKNKQLGTIGLSDQSLNFKMYFCRNINKLQIEQLCQFLEQKNYYIYIELFNELEKQIISPLQIQLFLEIINFIKKGFAKNKITPTMLSSNTIYSCMVNILELNAGLKQTKQYKKEEKNSHIANEICVFMDCFYILEMIQKERVDELVIQHQDFAKIMALLYKSISRSQFSEMFENKMEHYFRAYQKLSKKSEEIMYRVIFQQLYPAVIKLSKKSNYSFFKLTRDLILISSPIAIDKLFNKNPQNICFWQNCLSVIKSQSDHYSEMEKQNKVLSGHLIIFDALIKKNPSAITQQICRMILFNCLCYREGETYFDNIKCVSKSSIQAALAVLSTMIKTSENYARLIVSELRINQQTKYWRTPDFWNVSIELQMKSPCGFVGLENPGCICYLNSFTQTLFMNEEFRRQVINFNAVDPSKDYSLLDQLRKIFLNLQFSNQKYLNPVPFTKTIKNTEQKPMIKIFQQMDIEEYSSILFDKIEKLLPKDQDFVKQIFGGTYSNDIISQECKHCSQREESFLSMQLDVKATLADSLKTLVKGELLQGENAYYCEKCNKKVRALKRMSIKKLPNNLIVCLKRFQYNFETDQKFKVNSCCQFPRELTLQPYSQQYLSSEQQLQEFNQRQDETGSIQRLPHEYFQYKLKGVIIHTGSSQSGHYYALIQTSRQPEKWLQFNDSSVTDFDIENLPDQAFGTDDIAFPKYKNAYMLVYQRKNKINRKQQQSKMQQQQKQCTSISSSPSYQFTPQSQKILEQIQSRNKEIQTFHTIFTPQYNQFIYEVIQHSIYTNLTLVTQYRQVMKQMNPGILMDNNLSEMEILLKSTNQGSKQFIQEVMKFYLQYCLFVRSREINIQSFIQLLYDLQCLISTQILRNIMDYFLHQLHQQLLVEQLFIEVSFRDKLIILAHFTCQIVLKRLKCKSGPNDPIKIIVVQLVESFMCVMIQNGVCCNQLMYIIRRIVDEFPYFVQYFQKMNLFMFVFQILAGITQSAQDKANKIQRLKSQVQRIIQQQLHQNSQKTDMQQQPTQLPLGKYQIKTVSKAGKCVLKQQSPQQAWNYLHIMYQYQNVILKQYQYEGEYLIESEEESKQNEMEKWGKVTQFKRDVFLSQFAKLKSYRIDHFIDECQGSKAARSLALFMCQIMHNCEQITDRLMGSVLKGLKALEAVNFRPHLILLYYMVIHDDELTNARCLNAVRVLTNALGEKNSKFFSETDIIHQWVMKLTLHSEKFLEVLSRTEEGIELFNQIIQRIEVLKRPSSELMKKHKNPNYERLNYIIHGLTVSSQQKDYDTLYQTKKLFFTKLFHEEPFPRDLQLRIQPLTVAQPDFKQLTHKLSPGQIVYYLYNKKWMKIIIKSCRYGFVSASRLILQPSEMKTELEHNWVTIHGNKVDIGQGYKMCDQQFHILQMEQKLVSSTIEQASKPTAGQKYSPPDQSSRINVNKQDPDSNMSYSSKG